MPNKVGINTPIDLDYKNKEWLKEQYIEKNRSMESISNDFNVSYMTIRHWLMKYNIPRRKAGFYIGNRKGKKVISSRSYALLYIPEHPRAAKTGYVYEHIIIAEKMIGRPLKYNGRNNPDNEIVHHIDGNKLNNKESNLYIMISKNHLKIHTTLMNIGYELFKEGLINFENGRYVKTLIDKKELS